MLAQTTLCSQLCSLVALASDVLLGCQALSCLLADIWICDQLMAGQVHSHLGTLCHEADMLAP